MSTSPVPLTVWTLPAPSGHTRPCPGSIRQAVATLVLDAYSRPGDVVVDLRPEHGEVAAAAITAGRTCLVGADSPVGQADLAGAAQLAVALPSRGSLTTGASSPLAAQTVRDAAAVGQAVLAPGGLVVLGNVGARPGHDPLGRAAAAMETAGYCYLQHIVVLLRPPAAGHRGRRANDHLDLLVFRSSR